MDKTAQRYISKVRSALRCPREDRSRLISDAETMVDQFAQENPGAFYQDYVDSFGPPRDFAQELLSQVDPEELRLYRQRLQRLVWAGVVALAALALFALGRWSQPGRTQPAPSTLPTAEQSEPAVETPPASAPEASETPEPSESPAAPPYMAYLEGFADAGELQYPEAVGNIVALGVMSGKEDGTYFDPTGWVTRAEMAKMICTVFRGGRMDNVADALKKTPSFSDIRGHWAEAYIESCTALGVSFRMEREPEFDADGVAADAGENEFDPDGVIGVYEAMRAALEALGCDQAAYQLEGEKCLLNTDELSRRYGLFDGTGIKNMGNDKLLDRDLAAQILYNMLNAPAKRVRPISTSAGLMWEYVDGEKMLCERYGFASWDEVTGGVASQLAVYSDFSHITHREAVGAMLKLGIMEGKDDGSRFDPTGLITRAEAAKMAFTIMQGDKVSSSLGLTRQPPSFSDIQGHWAESYIEYCVDMGIFPRNEEAFRPEENITFFELLEAALGMLGYDYASSYIIDGEDWEETADRLARTRDPNLYENLSFTFDHPINREDAAQLLYNALRCSPRHAALITTIEGETIQRWEHPTKDDGSYKTLLYERFNIDSVEELLMK